MTISIPFQSQIHESLSPVLGAIRMGIIDYAADFLMILRLPVIILAALV